MAWWDRSGDRPGDKPVKPLRRRSVYEDRPPARPKIIFSPTEGLLGFEIDGEFHPADGKCCEDPLYCHRRECWRPFGPTIGGVFGA
jgi:hypothetical protein